MPAILITGAAKRIGAATARYFAAIGWDIGLHYHQSETEAAALAEEIRKQGRVVALLQADLQSPDACNTLIQEAFSTLPELSCLVNNASVFKRDQLHTLSAETLQQHVAVHVQAPLLLSQQFAKYLPDNQPGNIINITDGMVGDSLSGSFFSYCVSKLALIESTPLLATELAPNIRVNAIGPGLTIPGEHDPGSSFDWIQPHIPLQQPSSPEELCKTIEFIIQSPNLTGQHLQLSGGMHLKSFMPVRKLHQT